MSQSQDTATRAQILDFSLLVSFFIWKMDTMRLEFSSYSESLPPHLLGSRKVVAATVRIINQHFYILGHQVIIPRALQ